VSGVHLNLALCQSKRHARILAAGHLIVLVLIIATPLTLQSRLILAFCLLANAVWVFSGFSKSAKITRITIDDDNLATVQDQRRHEIEQLSPVFISDWIMILKITANRKSHWLPLWQDSADAEQLRQLRVWILCGKWRKSRD
jgi:hypothetical protein